MPQVDRFSVSLDTELLAAFDHHIAELGYVNRSEAIRDLIRDLLIANRLQGGDEPAAAVLAFIRDHREVDADKRLRACLAEAGAVVAGLFTLPIDEHREAVAVGLKGPADRVHALANRIRAFRGITHGQLSLTSIRDDPSREA